MCEYGTLKSVEVIVGRGRGKRGWIKPVYITHMWKCHNEALVRMWRQGNPCTLLVECKWTRTLGKQIWRLLKKLKVEPPCYPIIPLLLHIYRGNEVSMVKRHVHSRIYCSTTRNNKQPKCPSPHAWAPHMCYMYKKNEVLSFVTTSMEPEILMLSQAQKVKSWLISLMCRIWKSWSHSSWE
jgi:hypothetical protein